MIGKRHRRFLKKSRNSASVAPSNDDHSMVAVSQFDGMSSQPPFLVSPGSPVPSSYLSPSEGQRLLPKLSRAHHFRTQLHELREEHFRIQEQKKMVEVSIFDD